MTVRPSLEANEYVSGGSPWALIRRVSDEGDGMSARSFFPMVTSPFRRAYAVRPRCVRCRPESTTSVRDAPVGTSRPVRSPGSRPRRNRSASLSQPEGSCPYSRIPKRPCASPWNQTSSSCRFMSELSSTKASAALERGDTSR